MPKANGRGGSRSAAKKKHHSQRLALWRIHRTSWDRYQRRAPRGGRYRPGRCRDGAGISSQQSRDPIIARQLARANVNRRHGWQCAAVDCSACCPRVQLNEIVRYNQDPKSASDAAPSRINGTVRRTGPLRNNAGIHHPQPLRSRPPADPQIGQPFARLTHKTRVPRSAPPARSSSRAVCWASAALFSSMARVSSPIRRSRSPTPACDAPLSR